MADRAKQRNDDLEDRAIGAPSAQKFSTNPSLGSSMTDLITLPGVNVVRQGRTEPFLGSHPAGSRSALQWAGIALGVCLRIPLRSAEFA